MIDENGLARLASMAHALRPDWPTKSLITYLHTNHARRAYRDLAVALAWVAAEPATRTPKRLEENGPWWQAAVVEEPERTPLPDRFTRCDHCCQAHTYPGEPCYQRADPEAVRRIRQQAKEAP